VIEHIEVLVPSMFSPSPDYPFSRFYGTLHDPISSVSANPGFPDLRGGISQTILPMCALNDRLNVPTQNKHTQSGIMRMVY